MRCLQVFISWCIEAKINLSADAEQRMRLTGLQQNDYGQTKCERAELLNIKQLEQRIQKN